jgi:acetylornithine/N-succinyldiaminopimelate aminotransferase
VVRFLAPLIVSEAEIEQSVTMLERACAAIESSSAKRTASL